MNIESNINDLINHLQQISISNSNSNNNTYDNYKQLLRNLSKGAHILNSTVNENTYDNIIKYLACTQNNFRRYLQQISFNPCNPTYDDLDNNIKNKLQYISNRLEYSINYLDNNQNNYKLCDKVYECIKTYRMIYLFMEEIM
jgi:hypothetical protein